jgi:hypothetical protein
MLYGSAQYVRLCILRLVFCGAVMVGPVLLRTLLGVASLGCLFSPRGTIRQWRTVRW